MIRIAIADDHEIVRNGLAMVIEREEGLSVVLQASSFAELVSKLEQTETDLLILDLNLGDMNGLVSIDNIMALYPSLPVLVLSAFPEELYAVRTFKSGASGYLNKAVVTAELIDAIHTIMNGKKYVSRTLSETLEYGIDLGKEETDPVSLLSKREFEVLSLMASGHTPHQIAEELDVSPKTVSTYRTRIMEKLMLKNPSQLLQFAYERFSSSS